MLTNRARLAKDSPVRRIARLGSTLIVVAFALSARGKSPPETLQSAVAWLEERSSQMIHDCRRTTRNGIAAFPPQVGGGYEAFWLRDYAYMLEGNPRAFTDQELKDAYRFLLAGQRADGAMVDCIKFDGTPRYMPGTALWAVTLWQTARSLWWTWRGIRS